MSLTLYVFQTGELQKSSADKKGDNKLCFQNEIELSKATWKANKNINVSYPKRTSKKRSLVYWTNQTKPSKAKQVKAPCKNGEFCMKNLKP